VTGAHRRALPSVYSLALALLIVAPLLRPGYLLLRDAVSTPRSYFSDAALGLSDAAPRATPQDFAVALASHVVDGGIVVKTLLILALWLAGWGAARLAETVLPEAGLSGQFVASTVAVWNPYVGERLLQGHWSLLVGYGCLPWIATAMLALRSAEQPLWSGLGAPAFFVALAGLTPTGLLLAAAVAVTCVAAPGSARPRWLCCTVALAGALLAALPWLTASAVGGWSGGDPEAQSRAVTAFAARAEPGLGTLGSLAGLGGVWNSQAVPLSRTTAFAVVSTAVLCGVVMAGLPVVVRRAAARPLLVLAAAAVLLPAALATAPGLALLRGAVDAAPGLAVIRDSQKWVALAMPGYALASAGAVLMLRRFLPLTVTALGCSAALIASSPDLAWGAGGRVCPVHYPGGWWAVSRLINDTPGTVAVLPAGELRRFSWSGRAPVLDPLPRWVRADVLTTGDLSVSGVTVAGEGTRARVIQRLLLGGADQAALRDAGVAWVLVESGTPGETGDAGRTVSALPAVYHDPDLTLYQVGGHSSREAVTGPRRVAVVAHLLWLAMLATGAVGMVSRLANRARRAIRSR
jgi:hypothetical protein